MTEIQAQSIVVDKYLKMTPMMFEDSGWDIWDINLIYQDEVTMDEIKAGIKYA